MDGRVDLQQTLAGFRSSPSMGLAVPLPIRQARHIQEGPGDLINAMESLRERDGIPFSEQIRRGLRLWFESNGVKTDRKRAVTRKRS